MAASRRMATTTMKHTVLIVTSLIMIYPLLWLVSASVKSPDEIFGSPSLWPAEISFGGFVRGWNGLSVGFGTFFVNTFVIEALSILGNLFACSLTAFAFSRLEFIGRRFWFAAMLLTMMLPYHVTLIPQYVVFLQLGWVNTILPLVVPKFLAADAFFIFMMVQFFRSIPFELQEAAMIDGCGPWRIYWNILLPLSLPVLATTAIFTFIWTWDDFLGPLVYLGDIKTYTVALGLRAFVDSRGVTDWNAVFSMSTIVVIPVFIVFLLGQKFLVEGIATSGMKG